MVGTAVALMRTATAKWRAFTHYACGDSLLRAFLRWAAWGVHCLLGRPAVVSIPGLDLRLHLLPRWKGCWKAIYVFRQRFFQISDPELDFFREALHPGDVFVDAGAFHGWYTLLASRQVGAGGQVLAFEPNPYTFAILRRNIDLNGCRNVRALNVALSNAEERRWLYLGPDDGSQSSLAPAADGLGREEIHTRRLDDVLVELGVQRVDFMKIDVQGAEASLLEGAAAVLQRSRPVIVFELAPELARDMGLSERGAWDFLAGLGYRFYRLAGRTLEPLPEFPELAEGAFINVVALPEHGGPAARPGGMPRVAAGSPS